MKNVIKRIGDYTRQRYMMVFTSVHARFCDSTMQHDLWKNHTILNDISLVVSVSVRIGTKEALFWLSRHFLRGQNTENPVPRSFLGPQPHEDACYRCFRGRNLHPLVTVLRTFFF